MYKNVFGVLAFEKLGSCNKIFTVIGNEDYRQEQIEIDEAKEKNMNLSSSVKAMRKKGQRESTSPNEAQGYSIRTSTVAAA
ncbi:hypothetical protein PVK06_048477 [Gossypium arboreum]|uniref:Uncharacterized protein n=1 Tax=Gossypium arboreum TaxID=29729 RepID=A0ABR0MGJ8_GOSAR|nr:hypothetical protein PVK06_048477 [Gossypium arboreum]